MKVQFDFNYYVGANAFLILGAWEKEAKKDKAFLNRKLIK